MFTNQDIDVDATNKPQPANMAFNLARRFATLALPVGFSVGEFLAQAKEAFIEAATADLQKRGIRPTTSRIAVMTGLTRAEVSRIRDGSAKLPVAVSEPRTERVMHAWFTDSDYLDTNGNPRVLPEFGKGSFEELVRKHSGDMPRRALLEELISGGMAARESETSIRAIRRHYHSKSTDLPDFSQLQVQIDLAIPADDSTKNHAITVEFPSAPSPAVRKTISQRTERFLEAMSDYLHAEASRTTRGETQNKTVVRLMVSHGESKPTEP